MINNFLNQTREQRVANASLGGKAQPYWAKTFWKDSSLAQEMGRKGGLKRAENARLKKLISTT